MRENPRSTVESARGADLEVSTRNVLVVDALGEIFKRLLALDLPCALWRVTESTLESPSSPAEFDLAVCASYGPVDWEAMAQLTRRAPTLVITTAYERREVEQALRRDLVGYLDAAVDGPAFDRAMRGVLTRGEAMFPRDVIGAWLRERRAGTECGSLSLTERQRQIVSLIATGATDKEIASTLGIAPTTTQKHVTNILRRLNVPNRAAAVAVLVGPRAAY